MRIYPLRSQCTKNSTHARLCVQTANVTPTPKPTIIAHATNPIARQKTALQKTARQKTARQEMTVTTTRAQTAHSAPRTDGTRPATRLLPAALEAVLAVAGGGRN